jgi:eukaryotic-like serine/threonine-protein kinase
VEALFEEVEALPIEEREARLEEVFRGEPELANEVRRLLASHRRRGGILDRPVPLEALPPPPRTRLPRPVGPYRIVREVGRGGMAVVFLAERADGQFRRRVALKLLRGEHDPEELHRRLEAERQILAALEHPNIAHLLDGGLTEDGRPYLVMEFVEGAPITGHCDGLRLSVEARLRIFLTVARAVHHAHARLVVHRDLKPSNIMVNTSGEVRLLDFGIAKVLDPEGIGLSGGEAPATRTGVRLLTPEYASPEQLRGEPTSVSNDIWGLGVILYELLSGTRPFQQGDDRFPELERRVLEVDPRRPSARVMEGSEENAACRGVSRKALHRILEGDLDRIVAMALRKDPARRYASAEQFAEDVERFLEGRPVRAQPDRAAYRMGKFLRRHRLESMAAELVLLSVAGGTGAALWQAREAREERDRAEVAALRSDAAAEYLLDLFRAADPWELPADRLTARQLLGRGEGRLASLPEDPLLRARLLLGIGQTYMALRDAQAARPLLEEALEIRRSVLGDGHPLTAEAMRAVADFLRGEGRLAEAEAWGLRALQASREGRGIGAGGDRGMASDPVGEAASLSLLGFIRTGMGRLEEAMDHFQEELTVLRQAGMEDAPEAGHALVNLAAIHRRRARYDRAEALLREALEHRQRNLGPEAPLTAVTLARLGGLLSEHLGRFQEASRLFQESLAILDRELGTDHPARIEPLGGLAIIREALGDTAGAEVLLRESLRTHQVGLGSDHPTSMVAAEGLAGFLARTGRPMEADSIYAVTLPSRRLALGDSHPSLAGSLGGWGRVLLSLGRVDDAEAAIEEALRIRERVFGTDHALVGLTLAELASVHAARGTRGEEIELLSRALEILEAAHAPDHPETLALRRRVEARRAGLPSLPDTVSGPVG